MEIFNSRIDTWLAIVLGLTIMICAVSLYLVWGVLQQSSTIVKWAVVSNVGILGIALPVSILFGTHYIVSDNTLTIRASFAKWTIPVDSITSIKSTRNPISSPALSLDRLELTYASGGKKILISPRNQDDFLKSIGKTISD